MSRVVYPCCGKRINSKKNGKELSYEELQQSYDEHKKECEDYKQWIKELKRRRGKNVPIWFKNKKVEGKI